MVNESRGVLEERLLDISVYKFVVDEFLVGDERTLLEVHDVSGQCGYPIRETGGRHLFQLQRDEDDVLFMSACSGSHAFSGTFSPQPIVDQLRSEADRQGLGGSFTDEPLSPWATAAGLGVALALGAGLLVGVRRLRGN